jgi:methyltransferase (TIGR00027 family)
VRTHFFDAYFATATESGIRQAVILAAGLDSRAYRLAWPSGTVVYEIDLPKVLDYKTETLAKQGADPTTTRRAVPVDLRHDWPKALRGEGFDPTQPTAWLAEGLLPFLPADAQEAMFASIDKLSAAGSRVAVEVFGVEPDQRKEVGAKWAQLRAAREKRGEDVSFSPFELWFDEEGRPDSAAWFSSHGWTTQTVDSREEATRLGRPPSSDDARFSNKFVVAGKT